MPISDGYRAISGPWAEDGDRTDPTDTSLAAPVTIADGWGDEYSTDPSAGGVQPPRAVVNELLYRRDSALIDIRNYGVLPYDPLVDTVQGGVRQVAGRLFRATVAVGPSHGNAVSPTAEGQTLWEGISGTINAPSAPAAPQAVEGNGRLEWFWDCPLDGGAKITEFDLQTRSTGGWSASTVVAHPRRVISGLVNGLQYQARVRARNSEGMSDWSPVGSATPQGGVPAGGGQLGLLAAAGDGQVVLSWLTPDDGGLALGVFTVQWRSGSQSFGSSRQSTAQADANSAIVSGLSNGTAYEFRVRASNSAGAGAWSNIASASPAAVVPDVRIPGAPGTPSGLVSDGRIVWTWPPAKDNGGRISSYQSQWREFGEQWPSSQSTTSTAQRVLSGRTNGTTYQLRARAVNSAGTGPWSAAGQATPIGTVPDRVSRVFVTAGDGQLLLSWGVPEDNGAAISEYDVQISSSSSFPDDATTVDARVTSGTAYTRTGLSNGTTYYARVRAVNSRGDGPWSPTASAAPVAPPAPVQEAPDAPTGLSGETIKPQQIRWTWQIPADGTARITGFRFQWRNLTAGESWSTSARRQDVTVGTVLQTGLVAGNNYQGRVLAINSVGAGPWSTAVTATAGAAPDPAPVEVPGKVPSLAGASRQPQSILWTWGIPADGTSRITGFDIQLRRTGTQSDPARYDWSASTRVTGTSRLWTGLVAGRSYDARVRAVNANGTGAWSDIASANGGPSAPTVRDVTVTMSQSFRWPSGGYTSGTVELVGGAGGAASGGDFNIDIIGSPQGLWSDGTTIWVASFTSSTGSFNRLYAYTLATGARDANKDITLSGNTSARGLWSDGTTIWVSAWNVSSSNRLYAYTLATGARDANKDIALSRSVKGIGIWSDGTTMWVADGGDDRLYAFTLATGARDTNKEFNLASANAHASGLWSDGTTAWVPDRGDDRLYAYTLATGARDTNKEFNLASAHFESEGVWSDGATIWVVDRGNISATPHVELVFAYRLSDGAHIPNGIAGGAGGETSATIAGTKYAAAGGAAATTGATRRLALTAMTAGTTIALAIGAGGTGAPPGANGVARLRLAA